MESFQHRAAKALLAEWLSGPGRRGWPHFGDGRVLVEYPILFEHHPFHDCTGNDTLWDESGWNRNLPGVTAAIPTYDDLKAAGRSPAVIADIVVTHKGALRTLIEVVHKSGITPKKLTRLYVLQREGQGFNEVYTVPAQWIMGQVSIPETFAGTRIL